MQKTDLLERWVATLRSGEYEQTTGQLCRIDDDGKRTYCCLGVLAAIAGDMQYDIDRGTAGGSFLSLGVDIRAEYGLTQGDCRDLASWNDEEGLTFNEIADKIEERWTES